MTDSLFTRYRFIPRLDFWHNSLFFLRNHFALRKTSLYIHDQYLQISFLFSRYHFLWEIVSLHHFGSRYRSFSSDIALISLRNRYRSTVDSLKISFLFSRYRYFYEKFFLFVVLVAEIVRSHQISFCCPLEIAIDRQLISWRYRFCSADITFYEKLSLFITLVAEIVLSPQISLWSLSEIAISTIDFLQISFLYSRYRSFYEKLFLFVVLVAEIVRSHQILLCCSLEIDIDQQSIPWRYRFCSADIGLFTRNSFSSLF